MAGKRAALRQELETAIERALELLDKLDGDPDLEGEDHEGEPRYGRRFSRSLAGGALDWDAEPGAWLDTLDQRDIKDAGHEDSEPDEMAEDSLVPATGGVRLPRARRNTHGVSLADTAHRDAERARRIANGSGRIARLDYGPFNPVKDAYRVVPRNHHPQRRVRAGQ